LQQFEEWIRRESLKNHIEKSSVHKKSLEQQTQQNSTINQPEDLQADDFATAQAISHQENPIFLIPDNYWK